MYVSDSASPFSIRAFNWEVVPVGGSVEEAKSAADFDDTQLELVPLGDISQAGTGSKARPMVVVPAPPGSSRRSAFLVVGVYGTHRVQILSLPGYDTVCAPLSLGQGVQVVGLAADSAGSALLVADAASKSILVLPWPLTGMPDVA